MGDSAVGLPVTLVKGCWRNCPTAEVLLEAEARPMSAGI
jgi:hypothetical protein